MHPLPHSNIPETRTHGRASSFLQTLSGRQVQHTWGRGPSVSLKALLKDFEEGIAVLAVVWKPSSDIFCWDQENKTCRTCHNSSKDNHRSNWETLLKKILSPHHFCVLEDGGVRKTDADDTPSKVSQKRKTVEKFGEHLTNLLNFGFHFVKNVQ